MSQVRVDIEHKLADIELKRQQLRWEPLKMAATLMGAGAAIMGAAVGVAALLLKYLSQ